MSDMSDMIRHRAYPTSHPFTLNPYKLLTMHINLLAISVNPRDGCLIQTVTYNPVTLMLQLLALYLISYL